MSFFRSATNAVATPTPSPKRTCVSVPGVSSQGIKRLTCSLYFSAHPEVDNSCELAPTMVAEIKTNPNWGDIRYDPQHHRFARDENAPVSSGVQQSTSGSPKPGLWSGAKVCPDSRAYGSFWCRRREVCCEGDIDVEPASVRRYLILLFFSRPPVSSDFVEFVTYVSFLPPHLRRKMNQTIL